MGRRKEGVEGKGDGGRTVKGAEMGRGKKKECPMCPVALLRKQLILLCCIVKGHVFLGQIPVVVEVEDREVAASFRVKLKNWRREKEKGREGEGEGEKGQEEGWGGGEWRRRGGGKIWQVDGGRGRGDKEKGKERVGEGEGKEGRENISSFLHLSKG
jgi:hypothetical protein